MPLISKLKIFVSFFILYFSMVIYANELIPPKEILGNKILEHYFLKVSQSYDALNDKVDECRKEEKRNTISSFNYNDTNLQNIDIYPHIFYIYTKNGDSCFYSSLKNLTYDMIMIKSLLKKKNIKETTFLSDITNIIAVPSILGDLVDMEINYKKLPKETREYLEKTLGTRPFNFRPFMDKQTEKYEKERELRLKK